MRYKLGTLDLMESFYLSFFSYRKGSFHYLLNNYILSLGSQFAYKEILYS